MAHRVRGKVAEWQASGERGNGVYGFAERDLAMAGMLIHALSVSYLLLSAH